MKSNLNEKDIIKQSKKFDKNVFVIIILLAIIVLGVLYFLPKYGYENSAYIALLLMTIFGIFNKFFINIINDTNRRKTIKQILYSKYSGNDIIFNQKPKSNIVYGDKTNVGNIRNKYVFSISIKKYNCEFKSYSREMLERYYNANRVSFPTYRYVKMKYLNEYVYDLKYYGINCDENDLAHESIQNIINELKKIKNIEVTTNDNKLVVIKETMKNNYTREFAELDVNDIELFYNMLINKLKEVKSDGNQKQNIDNHII